MKRDSFFGRAPVLVRLFAAALSFTGCQNPGGIETGGETHFLKSCSPEDDTCGDSFACVCGVCTRLCDDQATCADLPGATCVVAGEVARCGADVGRRCDIECQEDDDCGSISPFHVCDEGMCRTEGPAPIELPEAAVTTEPSASPTSESSTSETSMSEADAAPPTDAPVTCESRTVSPNEVLIMGDSFFAQTHQVTAYLEDFARSAGALAEGERYRDVSRVVANTLANGGIEQQFLTALADATVKIVITNGGGADALLAMCDVPDETCTTLTDAVNGAESLLVTLAENAVSDVIFAFYPEAADDALSARVDFMRPLIEARCEAAPVACHWLDLRTVFEGNYDAYLGPEGMFPSAVGAEASARAIWDVMQTNCIAQ